MSATTATLRTIPLPNGKGDVAPLPQEAQDPTNAFPYLEKIGMVAKKYPYAMLTAIISIASVVVICITTLSVAIIGSVFMMYGTMREIQSQQQTQMDQLAAIRVQQRDDGNAMRAYEAANGKRTEFMIGLMSTTQQRQMNEYDQTHPTPAAIPRQGRN